MHQDYLAALERLRRVASGESFVAVYGNKSFDSLSRANADKLAVYDAEHDDRPATVEWLESIAGAGKLRRHTCNGITFHSWPFGLEMERDQWSFLGRVLTNPTRGVVLRLLGVFKREV